jgi:hypothetical protein
MRGRGIHYDVGFSPNGHSTRERFDKRQVASEMKVIAEQLHCNAVRVSGGDPERLSIAGELAADCGLEVWYAPFPCELSAAELPAYFDECAQRAEQLRGTGAPVVFVCGCELSLFARGFIPGRTFSDRMEVLRSSPQDRDRSLREIPDRINPLLAEIASIVRSRFRGRISYASIPIEHVDWEPFDIIGIDAYRSRHNQSTYAQSLRESVGLGKPVAITEVGCCTYRGAGAMGAAGWFVLDEDGTVPAGTERDEGEQVRYMDSLLPLFEAEGIDTVFWFTFANYHCPHRPDPRLDLDVTSYGIVAVADDAAPGRLPWTPKEAFHALARHYAPSCAR